MQLRCRIDSRIHTILARVHFWPWEKRFPPWHLIKGRLLTLFGDSVYAGKQRHRQFFNLLFAFPFDLLARRKNTPEVSFKM